MRDFNGTTDRIDYSSAFATNGQPITISAWANFDSNSPGAVTRFIFNSAVSGGGTGTMFGQQTGVSGGLQFVRVRAGGATNRVVNSNTSLFSISTPTHVAVVDTGTLSAGNTTIYVDGASVGLASDSAGSGTEDTANTGFQVGGRSSADDRNFNGKLGHVAVWNRALSADEVGALAKGASPMLYANGLKFYARIDGADYTNLLDASGTLDGTTDHYETRVLTFRPRLARVGLGPAAGAAPTISSTSDTNTLIDESAFVITGTNLTSATAVTFKQTNRPDYNATAFITANDATTATLTGLDVQDMSMAYGAATVSVTTAGGTSADFAITINKQATHQYITLSGHTPGDGWALGEATANSDQLVAGTTTTLGGTFAFVGTDGSYTITYAGDAPTNDSIYWAWFDDSDDQWYESTVSINPAAAAGGTSASILSMMRHRDRKHLRHR